MKKERNKEMQNYSDKKFDDFIHSEMNDLKMDDSFDAQWDKMSSALNKKSFFQFSVNRFNIYYLFSSALLLAGSLYFLLYKENNQLSEENNKVQNTTFVTVDSMQAPVEVETEKEIEKRSDAPSGNTELVKRDSDVKKTNESTPTEIKPLTDTTSRIEESKPPVVEIKTTVVDSAAKKAPKKIKYVTKRDTIITLDTNKIRRKR